MKKQSSLERIKKATDKKLERQKQESEATRYNKLSGLLASLSASKDPLDIGELGEENDAMQLGKYFKKKKPGAY